MMNPATSQSASDFYHSIRSAERPSPQFSVYAAPISNKNPYSVINLNNYMKMIRSGSNDATRSNVARCRELLEAGDDDGYAKQKLRTSYVTFSGVFTERGLDNLDRVSRYMILDIDKLGSVADAVALRDRVSNDEFTAAAFLTISGRGVRIVVQTCIRNYLDEGKTDGDRIEGHYKVIWQALSDYYVGEYGVDPEKSDKSVNDVARASFDSYDPDGYYNPESSVFVVEYHDDRRESDNAGSKRKRRRRNVYGDIESAVHAIMPQSVGDSEEFNALTGQGVHLMLALLSVVEDGDITREEADGLLREYKLADYAVRGEDDGGYAKWREQIMSQTPKPSDSAKRLGLGSIYRWASTVDPSWRAPSWKRGDKVDWSPLIGDKAWLSVSPSVAGDVDRILHYYKADFAAYEEDGNVRLMLCDDRGLWHVFIAERVSEYFVELVKLARRDTLAELRDASVWDEELEELRLRYIDYVQWRFASDDHIRHYKGLSDTMRVGVLNYGLVVYPYSDMYRRLPVVVTPAQVIDLVSGETLEREAVRGMLLTDDYPVANVNYNPAVYQKPIAAMMEKIYDRFGDELWYRLAGKLRGISKDVDLFYLYGDSGKSFIVDIMVSAGLAAVSANPRKAMKSSFDYIASAQAVNYMLFIDEFQSLFQSGSESDRYVDFGDLTKAKGLVEEKYQAPRRVNRRGDVVLMYGRKRQTIRGVNPSDRMPAVTQQAKTRLNWVYSRSDLGRLDVGDLYSSIITNVDVQTWLLTKLVDLAVHLGRMSEEDIKSLFSAGHKNRRYFILPDEVLAGLVEKTGAPGDELKWSEIVDVCTDAGCNLKTHLAGVSFDAVRENLVAAFTNNAFRKLGMKPSSKADEEGLVGYKIGSLHWTSSVDISETDTLDEFAGLFDQEVK